METRKGTVAKIRTLKFSAKPLVRFSLDNTNCLIANHSLNFLADVDENMELIVYGYYNKRNQFVVQRYQVQGNTRIMYEMNSSRYPHKKVNI